MMQDDLGAPTTALVFNFLDCRSGCDAPSLGESGSSFTSSYGTQ
jgi:hypothetical protein